MSRVNLAPLCHTHQVLLVQQCAYGPNDTWQALMIVTQIALFQGASTDPKVHAETSGQVEALERLGCLACRKPDLFGAIVDTVQRTFPRSAHVRAVKELGERWVREASSKGDDQSGVHPEQGGVK